MIVRTETPDDHAAVQELVDAAFGGELESLLIDLIRRSDRFVPDLALVAERDGEPIGHVLFSFVTLAGNEAFEVLSLAPLAVHPDHQGRGFGGALVREGLARADARGEPLVVVEGHPGYYPKFGFETAARHGIEKADARVPDEAFMIKRLDSYEPRFRGRLVYSPAFHEAEAIGP